MGYKGPFGPATGGTKSIAATTGSGSITLDATDTDCDQLYLVAVNASTSFCVHVELGDGSATATTASFAIPYDHPIVIDKPQEVDTVAARTDAGTGTLYITPGDGKL